MKIRKRLICLLPGLLSDSEQNSVLRNAPPSLIRLAEEGMVFQLSESELSRNSLEWFGLNSEKYFVPYGSAVIADLGAYPPERSVRMAVQILSLDESEKLSQITGKVNLEEKKEIEKIFMKLDSRKLVSVLGMQFEHGLVWENGSLELKMVDPYEAIGKSWNEVLPVGEKDSLIRQWIEDSIDLLFRSEMNKRRFGEGLAPLSVFWPYGHGLQPELPNLALKRGEPVTLHSDSLSHRGMARMVGYWPSKKELLFEGMHLKEKSYSHIQSQSGTQILDAHWFLAFSEIGREEEMAFAVEQFSKNLIEKWQEAGEFYDLLLVATDHTNSNGLVLVRTEGMIQSQSVPFDERVFGDSQIKSFRLFELTERFLTMRIAQ